MLKVLKVKLDSNIRRVGNKFGVDVKMSDEERFMKLLKHHDIDLILDVGANVGQFAELMFGLGFKGKVVSIEPLPDAYEILKRKSQKNENWIVPERMALGDETGEIEINVSANSVSSSILEIREEHTSSEPESKYVKKEITKIFRLDELYEKLTGNAKNVLVKIDTQGYEDNVLKGAQNVIDKIKGLQMEISILPLYEGQKLYIDMFQIVKDLGYQLEFVESGFVDKKSGRTLQIDCAFFR